MPHSAVAYFSDIVEASILQRSVDLWDAQAAIEDDVRSDRATEDLYHNRPTSRAHRFPSGIILALFKMDLLNGAAAVLDLRSPPGNRLEALEDDLNGYHSIRVNEQWRLVFRWDGNNAHEVRLMDYHR